MSSTVGKITGQMLESNLLRDGVDLAFDTDLIYLDVINQRVGIKTETPYRTLLVNGTISTTNLNVDNQVTISNFLLSTNTITNNIGNIFLSSTQPGGSITTGSIEVDGLRIDNNKIYSLRSNENIDFTAAGTGGINFNSNVEVTGDIHVTGDVTFDGDVILGSNNTDSIIFDNEVASDIIPNTDSTYYLGSASKKWSSLDTSLINGNSVVALGGATVFGIDMNLRQGNIWYVSTNGSYDNYGDHPNDPFDTIEKALTVASAGDTIFIHPGVYYELLPLTIPAGVTVKGFGVRSVIIKPDTASSGENVFLLNGETTVEDLTIADFYYDNINDTGYAFSFAPGFTVTTRSPYIRNVTVITKGSVTSLSDPRGFDTGDAGRGAKIDGSLANAASKEASMLFHSVTFITPGQRCLWMTNGVRVEWLNCFVYFSSEGLYANIGASGFAGAGKTRLKIYGISAQTINTGDTVSVENVNQNNTFTTATIESVTYNGPYTTIVIDGYVTGWEVSASPPDTSNQQQINFSGGQTASHLEWVDYSDFGAELRAIGSANVYGTVGAKADGAGTIMYLISHNFGYIGSGKLSNNDISDVVDTNETIEINNGKIYYQSMDQEGNFRVGDIFKIESATGRITFQSNLFTGTNLTLTDGTNITYVDPLEISTGNITISGNTIQSNSGSIILHAANSEITLPDNFTTNNNLTTNNFVLNKNLILGTNDSNSINFYSTATSNFVPNNDLLTLGLDSKRWKTLYATNLTFDDILIDTNVISTTLSNSNLQLDANGKIYFDNITFTDNAISTNNNLNLLITPDGTGTIQLEKDTYITGNLNVSESVTVGGNVRIGDILFDQVNTVGRFASNIIPDVTAQYDIGSLNFTWRNLYFANTTINGIAINDNYIAAIESNGDLELRSNGSGSVRSNSNLISDQNFTVAQLSSLNSATITTTSVVGDIVINNNFNAPEFSVGDILINDNYITTTLSNSNLELRANNIGGIILDETIKITNSTIENILNLGTEIQRSITFTPAPTKNLKLGGTIAFQIPIGNNTTRVLSNNGEIRFNNSNNVYEGKISGGTKNLYALYDVDRNTGITAELTPGTNDNIIRMFVNNIVETTVTTEQVSFNSLTVDQLNFNNNKIATILSNTDIELERSGTGAVIIQNNISIINNLIFNIVNDAATEIASTDEGYVQFYGTGGVVIPSGNIAQQLAVHPVGSIRYNTEIADGEVWTGSDWIPMTGIGPFVTNEDMEDIGTFWALIVG